MSIYINKDTKVITQGITGKTGQFHTEKCQEYANGKNAFVAGVNPKKAGESIFNIPIYASVKEAATQTGATVSVIYVPPAGAAAAIWEAVAALEQLGIVPLLHLVVEVEGDGGHGTLVLFAGAVDVALDMRISGFGIGEVLTDQDDGIAAQAFQRFEGQIGHRHPAADGAFIAFQPSVMRI